MSWDETTAYLFWSKAAGVGWKRLQRLIKLYGDVVRAAWPPDDWQSMSVAQKYRADWLDWRGQIDRNLNHWRKQWQADAIGYLSPADASYPGLLNQLHDPPIGIFYQGGAYFLAWLSNYQPDLLAVVGTRRISAYGRQATEQLVVPLVKRGLGIISGLMYGVDQQAHLTAVRHQGFTIGVWAGGLKQLAESSRGRLAQEILAAGGGVISQYWPDEKPQVYTFPARNRLVAALAVGTLVIEGAADSGSLITAGYAAELGREVMAVPGKITSPLSAAPHRLIQAGASLVNSAEDVWQVLYPQQPWSQTAKQLDLSDEQHQIWQQLVRQPMSTDQLSLSLGWPLSQVQVKLTELEIAGLVQQQGGYWQVRA